MNPSRTPVDPHPVETVPLRRRHAARTMALAVIAGAIRIAAAHPGDHSFFDALDAGQFARLAPGASAGVQAENAREVGSLFGTLANKQGHTLLPRGTSCDSAEVTSGILTVRFTLPGGMREGDLTDMDHETAAAILVRHAAVPSALSEVRLLARRAPGAAYAGMESFVPPPPPVPSPLPAWGEPPPVPGPDYQRLYRLLQSQTGAEARNVAGQGPVATSGQPAGVLSGRTIFFSGGHGWTANDSESGGDGSWFTQRPFLLSMCEDYGNIDQANFLAEALFNAGATVVCMRPLGYQTNEVVLDNTSAEVAYAPTAAAWALSAASTDNYGDSTGNTMCSIATAASETATATYAPTIPAAGFYPVYCFANAGSNRTSGQLYRIRHSGGETQVRVNHRRVGRGWVWLGNYYFAAGRNPATCSVVVSNLEPPGGTAGLVVADAIRFGNGMGSIARGAGVSGKAREAEASRYWLVASEAPASVYNPSSTDQNDNVSAPSRMAAYMRDSDGQGYNGDIYLGFHTNASSGSARGSVGLITNSATVTNQPTWAALSSDTLDTQCFIEDANWEHTWGNYGLTTLTSAYGEISSGLNSEMCGTIIEVAFHDNTQDSALLRDPKVRYAAARSQVHAMIKYFNQFDGMPLNYPPERPERVRVCNNGTGGVLVNWAPVAAGAVGTGAATGYRVCRSTDGLNFGNPVQTAGNAATQALIAGLPVNTVHYFRVSAVNAGGESSPSEVVAVRVSSSAAPVLIVNGYDRIDRLNNVPEFPANPAGQEVQRLRVRRNNSYDYMRAYAPAAAAANRWFDSCSNEAIISGDIALSSYQSVIWISGEESAADKTFDATERTAISNFLALGGRGLFVSGSEIGYELASLAVAPAFYNTDLRAGFSSNDAATYSAAGVPGSILAGISADFGPGSDMYDVDAPDVLTPLNGSAAAMTYAGASGGAVQLEPFEAIGGWKDPNYSGSTNADAASTFLIAATPVRQGTGSADLFYVWGASGTQVRVYNSSQPAVAMDATLSIWVYGDNSGHQLSFLVRDTSDTELFQSTPILVNFTGWRQITWALASDPGTRWFGAGDGVFTGTTVTFDSILLNKVSATTSSHLYFDDITYTTPSPGGGGVAAVQYAGAYKLVNFGFPFEAIGDAATREQAMLAVLNFLGAPVPVGVSRWELE
jgi:hypothetical protein